MSVSNMIDGLPLEILNEAMPAFVSEFAILMPTRDKFGWLNLSDFLYDAAQAAQEKLEDWETAPMFHISKEQVTNEARRFISFTPPFRTGGKAPAPEFNRFLLYAFHAAEEILLFDCADDKAKAWKGIASRLCMISSYAEALSKLSSGLGLGPWHGKTAFETYTQPEYYGDYEVRRREDIDRALRSDETSLIAELMDPTADALWILPSEASRLLRERALEDRGGRGFLDMQMNHIFAKVKSLKQEQAILLERLDEMKKAREEDQEKKGN